MEITVKDFIKTMTTDDVIIADTYSREIVTWAGSNPAKLENILTKEILDSKIILIYSKDNRLIVLTDYKEDNE